jgi:hypothetical protein
MTLQGHHKGLTFPSTQQGLLDSNDVSIASAVANMLLSRNQVAPSASGQVTFLDRNKLGAPLEICGSGDVDTEAAVVHEPESLEPGISMQMPHQHRQYGERKYTAKCPRQGVASSFRSLPAMHSSVHGSSRNDDDAQSLGADDSGSDDVVGSAVASSRTTAPDAALADIEAKIARLQDQPDHETAIMMAVLNIFWLLGSSEDDPSVLASRHVIAQEARCGHGMHM